MEENKQSQIQLSFGDSVPGIETIEESLIIFKSVTEIFLSSHPLRVDLAMLVLCTGGRTRTAINLNQFELTPNSVLIAMPDQILQQLERSEDFSGLFIGVSRKLIKEVIPSIENRLPTLLFVQEHPLTHLNENEAKIVKSYFSFLANRVGEKENRYHKHLTFHLLSSLFYDIFNIVFAHHEQVTVTKNKQESIFEQFLTLVHDHFLQERSVSFYARQMNLTAKYISQTIKAISGKTAGEWIDLYVILEARVLLRSTSLSVQEVSDRLHFTNQSIFGKYFKLHTGYTPKEYRKLS